MKLYIAWRDGLWPAWPVGDTLPDAVVRGLFSVEPPSLRSVLIWLLSRDVMVVAAAVCLVVWLLGFWSDGGDGPDDRPGEVSR